jgi:predicted CoA-binding protein
MSVRALINEFLKRKRVAVVGVSRHPQDFTRSLFREFVRRGYDVVPVTPQTRELEGRRCYARVQDIPEPVEAALLLTPSAVTLRIVRDCAEAGVPLVWMYRASGRGAVSREAIEFCEERGIRVIPGHCPYMFFPNTGLVHRFHGFVLKIARAYPA